jgi:hypothetical protein
MGEFGEGTGECRISVDLAFSICAKYEQMSVRLMVCQVTQQVEARRIRPVEVIEGENKSMGCTYSLQEGADSFIESEACLLRK